MAFNIHPMMAESAVDLRINRFNRWSRSGHGFIIRILRGSRVLHRSRRVSGWIQILTAKGLILGSLAVVGCSEEPAADPATSKTVQSRIKRMADGSDDVQPSAKGKVKSKARNRGN